MKKLRFIVEITTHTNDKSYSKLAYSLEFALKDDKYLHNDFVTTTIHVLKKAPYVSKPKDREILPNSKRE